MKLAVLFSGGKDSTYALYKAKENNEIACLIAIISKNPESYMFHTPNIDITALQAEALGIPLIKQSTLGKKEEELKDLKKAILKAKKKYWIDGVVTGAVESVYQAERVQMICDDLDLWCFNPLWKKDQEEFLDELLQHGFKVIISGVFAYPLTKEWLGKEIDKHLIKELVMLQQKYGISPAGEGGEIETTVLDAPLFIKKISVIKSKSEFDEKGGSGVFRITKAGLVDK